MQGIEAQKQVRIGAIIKTENGCFYRREPGTVGGFPAWVRIEIRNGNPRATGRKTGLVVECQFKMVTA